MKNSYIKIIFFYMLSVPVLVTLLAFLIGHVSGWIYIPLWLLNLAVMAYCTRVLVRFNGEVKLNKLVYLIFPWMLFSVFAGMGPPPDTASGWATLATEQVFRYTILIIGGISVAIGFCRLRGFLEEATNNSFGKWASVLMWIAIPLFVLNMSYWGYFLTTIFVKYNTIGGPTKPHWIGTLGEVFTIVRMIEVTLIYLATAAFAIALRLSGRFSKTGSRIYIFCCCLGASFNLVPGTLLGPLAIANYLSYIPAFTLLMPYLMALNLLIKPVHLGKPVIIKPIDQK